MSFISTKLISCYCKGGSRIPHRRRRLGQGAPTYNFEKNLHKIEKFSGRRGRGSRVRPKDPPFPSAIRIDIGGSKRGAILDSVSFLFVQFSAMIWRNNKLSPTVWKMLGPPQIDIDCKDKISLHLSEKKNVLKRKNYKIRSTCRIT